MASTDAVSIVRELGIRELGESWTLALFVAADHAAPYPPSRTKAGNQETNRLAHFSAHVFDAASDCWCGTENHVGTATAFDDSRKTRYVHTSGHNSQTQCARGGSRTLVPRKKGRKRKLCLGRFCFLYLFCAFCAHAKMMQFG